MKKKGQVTIFIIIIIIVIALIVSFFIFKDTLKRKIFIPETDSVKIFVENCIENVGGEIIYDLGRKGGYFFAPDFSTDTGIPIYYSNGKNYMPTKNQIENEISYYINERLFFCTRNFVDFPELEITQGEIETKTKIEENEIILDVKYPLSITKENDSVIIEDFNNIKIPVRFGIIYDSIYEIIQEQLNHTGICFDCMLDIALEKDLYVNMIDYDNETVIFIFRDENSKLNDINFEFIFANKYGIKEE